MPITLEQRDQLIIWLKDGKHPHEVAKKIGITKSSVQHYVNRIKFEKEKKEKEGFFNVNLYAKTLANI